MSADKNQVDPVEADEPPYFPMVDPDAPRTPDHEGVEPDGEQMPAVDADGFEAEESNEVVF